MQRILVPIDFSPASVSAWKTALYFAEIYRAELMVLHVCAPSFWEPYMPLLLETALKEKRQEEAQLAFSKWLQKWAIPARVNINHQLVYGDVEQNIKKAAQEWKADLIVMGNGKGLEIKKKWLGSTVSHVLNHCKAEILIVPEGKEIQLINQLVFAMPFEEERIEAIERVLLFTRKFDARVNCVHFYKKDVHKESLSKLEILQRAYRNELMEGIIQFELINERSFEKGLRNYLKHKKADLLVLMAQQREGLMEMFTPMSTAEEVMANSQLPVWTLPSVDEESDSLFLETIKKGDDRGIN